MKKLLLTTAFATVGFATAAFAGTDFVTNGDFSSPSFSPGGWGAITSPFMGWSDANGVLEIGKSNVYGLPCDNAACQSLEVNDTGPDIATYIVTGLTSGKNYVFSYAYLMLMADARAIRRR